MADLPNLAAPDENRSTVISRQGGGGGIPAAPTDTPGLQVTEFIPRHANMDEAEELNRVLGLAGETVKNIGNQLVAKQNAKDASQGDMDFATGQQNEQLFKNSQAYHAAWSMAGAKAAATQISTQATAAVNGLFNDPNNPPTPEEVHQAIEGVFSSSVLDPSGKPVQFGTPEAQAHVAGTLNDVRNSLLSQAIPKIKEYTDHKLASTSMFNYVNDGLARLAGAGPFETDATRRAAPAVDPLAPLPDPTADQPVTAPALAGGDAGFHGAVATVFKNEGGFNPQDRNGYAVNMGINAKYNPPSVLKKYGAADLSSLTQDQASQIYFDRYWKPSGAAALPAAMQTPYFDVYVRSPGVAKKALAAAGNDPAKFMQLASAKFQSISGGDQYGKAWANRDAALASAAGSSNQADVSMATPSGSLPPPSRQTFVDFNGYLDSLPPTVNKELARKDGLRQLIASASDNNDPRLLNGLEFLTQKDGAPTFSPEEQGVIVDQRNTIASRVEEKADKQFRLTQSDNFGKLMQSFVDGSPPSLTSIQAHIQNRDISPEQGWAMMEHITSEARQQRAETRADTAQAEAEMDANLAPKLVEAATGSNPGAYTDDKITQMFQQGDLGSGKRAAARALQLRNAAHAGIKVVESSPEYAGWLAKIDQTFGTKTLPAQGGAWSFMSIRHQDPNYNPVAKAKVLSEFKQLTDQGVPPAVAYSKAVVDQGDPNTPAVKGERAKVAARIKELQNK